MADDDNDRDGIDAAAVQALFDLARARGADGDMAGAARTWDGAVHLGEAHDLHGPIVVAIVRLAEVDVRARRLDEAQALLEEAWARCEAHPVGSRPRAEVAGRLGQILVFRGRPDLGVALMTQAVDEWERSGERAAAHELGLAIAAVCERVDQTVKDAGETADARAHALEMRARVKLAVGQSHDAEVDLERAWGLASAPAMRGRVGATYGTTLRAGGREARAQSILEAARQAWTEAGDPAWVARIDALLAPSAQRPGP
jgi:hypothetical protein